MNCSGDWIEGHLDEELDPGTKAAAEEHLAACAGCSGIYSRLREQTAEIKAHAPYYSLPAGLERSVRAALRGAAPDEGGERAPSFAWRPLAIAASLLLAVSVGWNVSQFRNRVSDREGVAQSVLSSHIRSLLGTHLLDVPSSDRHTVKPWFNGKLNFSPEVKDLASEGYPLAGGRVDYLSGRTVAALVYQRRRHIINVFIWPDSSPAVEDGRYSRNGFNVVHWSDGSMAWWAVSDTSMEELEQFKELLSRPGQ